MIAAGTFVAAAIAGSASQGWLGILLFPLAVAAAVVGVVIAWFLIDLVLTYQEYSRRVGNIRARVSRLSTEQLRAMIASPSHPDVAFALVELARRGIEMKPERGLLLAMLTSPDSGERARGMSLLHAFYPEVRLPEGSS